MNRPTEHMVGEKEDGKKKKKKTDINEEDTNHSPESERTEEGRGKS